MLPNPDTLDTKIGETFIVKSLNLQKIPITENLRFRIKWGGGLVAIAAKMLNESGSFKSVSAPIEFKFRALKKGQYMIDLYYISNSGQKYEPDKDTLLYGRHSQKIVVNVTE